MTICGFREVKSPETGCVEQGDVAAMAEMIRAVCGKDHEEYIRFRYLWSQRMGSSYMPISKTIAVCKESAEDVSVFGSSGNYVPTYIFHM